MPRPTGQAEILGRLGFDAAAKQQRPHIAEDFIFGAARFLSARALAVAPSPTVL
jgi:hypothetical protein